MAYPVRWLKVMIKDAGDGRENGTGAYKKLTLGPASHEGAVYAVAGCSGHTGGGALNHPAMFISLNSLGSLVLDISGGRLDAGFIDNIGVTRDYFTIIKGTPPLAPSSLTATAASISQIDLVWTDNATDEDGQKIERSTDGTSFQQIATAAANVTVYSDTGLAASSTYYYRVRAYNTSADSAYSNVANATTSSPGSPTIDSISPNSGSTAGNQSVNINGTNLSNASVTFGGTPAQKTFNDATKISVNTPAHTPPQAVDVVVTTSGGNVTSAGGYTYVAVPTITSISPNSGPTAGGQNVTINGSNLSGATAVTFGSMQATNLANNTATQITVTTPAHAFGVVEVVVTTPSGPATSTGGYTYVAAPIITSISPNIGPTAGGQSVNINGSNLSNSSVTFDSLFAVITNNTATQITLNTPAHSAAVPVDVAVTTPGGTTILSGSYTYQQPAAPTVPADPTNLTATPVSSSQVNLAWTDNSGNEDGFKIERSLNGTNFTQIATVGINVNTYPSAVLAPSTTYYYRVRAFNVTGNSGYTNIDNTTTLAALNNLVVNPGFELDANSDGSPDSWSSSSKFTRSFNTVFHGGSYAGKFFWNPDVDRTITQVVPNLTAGTTYNFSGWVNIPPTIDSFTFAFEVRWRNASNGTISTQTVKTYTTPTPNTWDQATASLIAPAGTTSAEVRLKALSLNCTIYIDDIVFGP